MLMKFAGRAGVLVFLGLAASYALRAADVEGDSAGKFINPVAGSNGAMTVSGVGTSTFNWGVGEPSWAHYANTPFSANFEDPFKIGTLTYHNGVINSGTGADGVSLDLEVSFTLPSGLNQSFVYPIQLINTPNSTGTDAGDADYLILSTFPSTVFDIGTTKYTLTLAFENLTGGGFIQTGNQLHVYEGWNATADLMGKVTTDISGVPDTAATCGLLGLALGGLAVLRRKLA